MKEILEYISPSTRPKVSWERSPRLEGTFII
jgi:hypothetical protein